MVHFFRVVLDYTAVEYVQFEDDDYYYYVKAVPKMTLAGQQKTVKHINTSRRPAERAEEDIYESPRAKRPVTTVRTPAARTQSTVTGNQRREHLQGAKSVTIGHSSAGMEDEFEDLD